MTELITPRVIGLDLSWTGTGMVDNQGRAEVFRTKPNGWPTKWHRLEAIVTAILEFCDTPKPLLICVEGPSFASKGRAVVDMGGLWWSVTRELWRAGHEIYEVPPSVRMMFATGKGQAAKPAVVAAVARREPDLVIDTDDIADAAVLRALAAALIDCPAPGWENMPNGHSRAIVSLVDSMAKRPFVTFSEDRVIA